MIFLKNVDKKVGTSGIFIKYRFAVPFELVLLVN